MMDEETYRERSRRSAEKN